MRVLVVNAGSSSLKLDVVGEDDGIDAALDLERSSHESTGEELDRFLEGAPPFDAVGHRVVHGGAAYVQPVVIDVRVEEELSSLADLAPLHNPPAVAAIHEMRRLRPDVPQVACFDTSFHAGMPPRAASYAVPARWREEWGIRRFGFHGLSHAWASRRCAELLSRPLEGLRMVTAHIGAGASLAAVSGGRSVDTTMGFTALEGLVMATRSGTVDPGAVLWVMSKGGLDPDETRNELERRSGLLALSGRSGDLRDVLAGVDARDPACMAAYDVYAYRIRTGIGAMAVAAGGMDALVFTGGAGEGSARLRADVCADLGMLGIAPLPDPSGPSGGTAEGDRLVSAPGVTPAVAVVSAREDLEIARTVRQVLSKWKGRGPQG